MKAICLPRRNRSFLGAFCSSRLTFCLNHVVLRNINRSFRTTFGLLPRLLHGYETHSGAITFPPEADSSWSHFQRAHPLAATPFQCPRSRTATLGLGAAALPCPYVGLTVVSVRRSTTGPVTQSIATPEPSLRTIPHPTSSAGRLLEP